MPTHPPVPIARGARIHSPLPIERPSAIRLGPMTSVTVSLSPMREAPNASSGVGRSPTFSGGPAPRGYSPVGGVAPAAACASIVLLAPLLLSTRRYPNRAKRNMDDLGQPRADCFGGIGFADG